MADMLQSESDVLIIGGGPVGLTAALCLAQRGVKTQIVDQISPRTPRGHALALHSRTLDLFAELGIARQLLNRGTFVDALAFYDGDERRATVALDALGGSHPYVLAVPQEVLESVLVERLAEIGAGVVWNHRAVEIDLSPEEDPSRVEVEMEMLVEEPSGYGVFPVRSALRQPLHTSCSYLIGADGHSSAVRKALALELEEVAPARTFGIVELQCDWQPHNEARVIFHEDSSSALWPLGRGRFRWAFELPGTDEAPPRWRRRIRVQIGEHTFPHITREEVDALLAERAPWFEAPISEVYWAASVRFENRLASRFGRDRAWLLGDAAHLTSPLAVRSLNLGLVEARDLSDRIARALGGEPQEELFAAYERERRQEWEAIFALSTSAQVANNAEYWLQENAGRMAASIPATGEALQGLAKQVDIVISDS